MTRTPRCYHLFYCFQRLQWHSFRKSCFTFLAQEELVRGEAQTHFEVNGDRRAACRLYRQAYQLEAMPIQHTPSEQTATWQYKSVVCPERELAPIW